MSSVYRNGRAVAKPGSFEPIKISTYWSNLANSIEAVAVRYSCLLFLWFS